MPVPNIRRHEANPLIDVQDVIPSHPDLTVVGVFNTAACWHDGECLLLLRVAEAPPENPSKVSAPILDLTGRGGDYRLRYFEVPIGTPGLDASDPRVFFLNGRMYLTSISHLRLARSKDGVHFKVDPTPTLLPSGEDENYGIEDPRITQIDGTYYINFTATSDRGGATKLVSTRDWVHFESHGAIFHPQNKDITIFPARFGDRYCALHRPDPGGLDKPSIWFAESPDMIHWGRHRRIVSPREGTWDGRKIGGGAPPVRTESGWLEIYHGVAEDESYRLGALLFDLNDPSRLIGRSPQPLLSAEEPYERQGFFANVVFTDGVLIDPQQPDRLLIYYGGADKCVCLAECSVKEIIESLDAL